jgi:hypothetical protein
LNRRPTVYETVALPLSYIGFLGDYMLNLYMVCSFYHENTLPSPTKRKGNVEWVKTPYPNLIRYKPDGNYCGRVSGSMAS